MTPLKDPNPLNINYKRRVDFLPSFFEVTYLKQRYNLQDSISKWIDLNLKGRYFVGVKQVVADSGTTENRIVVGFEREKELSYFMLACPHLKYD